VSSAAIFESVHFTREDNAGSDTMHGRGLPAVVFVELQSFTSACAAISAYHSILQERVSLA
jgi:hypothetical protein